MKKVYEIGSLKRSKESFCISTIILSCVLNMIAWLNQYLLTVAQSRILEVVTSSCNFNSDSLMIQVMGMGMLTISL